MKALWPLAACLAGLGGAHDGLAAGALNPQAGLIDVAGVDARFVLDIKYATADNFTHQVQYPVARCLLQPAVAQQLRAAQDALEARRPGLRLMLKDCYRPVSIQGRLFASVAGTPQARYVANPNRPSGAVHTFGAAVDVTLADAYGAECDMGTPYDFLGPLAEPRRETYFLAHKKLSPAQLARRRLLAAVMAAAGFKAISNEWWHFDALQGKALRARYAPLDVALDGRLDGAGKLR